MSRNSFDAERLGRVSDIGRKHGPRKSCHNQPRPATASQCQARWSHSQPDAARASQSQPEPARTPPEQARVNQSQPDAVKASQRQPEPRQRQTGPVQASQGKPRPSTDTQNQPKPRASLQGFPSKATSPGAPSKVAPPEPPIQGRARRGRPQVGPSQGGHKFKSLKLVPSKGRPTHQIP